MSKKNISTITFIVFVIIIFSLSILTNINQISAVEYIKTRAGFIFNFYALIIAILVFLESDSPAKTVAWLLVLYAFPLVGLVFYILFGQRLSKKFRLKKIKSTRVDFIQDAAYTQKEILNEIGLFKNDKSKVKGRLINLLLKNSNAPFTVNNKVCVFSNGEDKFNSLLEDLKSANEHIHMEYYIIRDDEIGNSIKDILVEKAKDGVEVKIIYDSVGCWKLSKKYRKELTEAGAQVIPFYPVLFPVLSRQLNYRNHRKIIIIDGKIGYLGGINIGDEYLGKDEILGYWRDTHIKIEGESVYNLQHIFLKDWYFVSKEVLNDARYYPRLEYYGERIVQITSSGPDSDWEAIQQAYFTMISTAESRIWIQTPYLVPDESIRMALKVAALSGIDVRIMIPSKADHLIVYWASQGNIEELVRAGVKIYTYDKGFIHSKMLLVDGISASIGTANLDIRSFKINFEVNAFIYDDTILKELEEDYIDDIRESTLIKIELHRERGNIQKLKEATGRLFSPLL